MFPIDRRLALINFSFIVFFMARFSVSSSQASASTTRNLISTRAIFPVVDSFFSTLALEKFFEINLLSVVGLEGSLAFGHKQVNEADFFI